MDDCWLLTLLKITQMDYHIEQQVDMRCYMRTMLLHRRVKVNHWSFLLF